MISKEKFLAIKERYGSVCSWAVWERSGIKPKSNISNMDIFDIYKNNELLEVLHTDVVMVALNFSREVAFTDAFMNFHDSSPHGQDYKIRYAIEDTPFYGAYMTDVIKEFPMLESKGVVSYLRKNPAALRDQIKKFEEELRFIQSDTPTIIAFGKDSYEILRKNLDDTIYSALIQVTHYSHYVNLEDYRKGVLQKLNM